MIEIPPPNGKLSRFLLQSPYSFSDDLLELTSDSNTALDAMEIFVALTSANGCEWCPAQLKLSKRISISRR